MIFIYYKNYSGRMTPDTEFGSYNVMKIKENDNRNKKAEPT